MVKQFTDEEQTLRLNNHEVMFRDMSRQLCDLYSYVFALESRVKEMELRQKVYESAIQKLANKMVIKDG